MSVSKLNEALIKLLIVQSSITSVKMNELLDEAMVIIENQIILIEHK